MTLSPASSDRRGWAGGKNPELPVALTCHIATHLDLASYARFKRVSRSARRVCETHRDASPLVVCCRAIPVPHDGASWQEHEMPSAVETEQRRRKFERCLRRNRDLFPDGNYRRAPIHDAHGPRFFRTRRNRILPTRLLPPTPGSGDAPTPSPPESPRSVLCPSLVRKRPPPMSEAKTRFTRSSPVSVPSVPRPHTLLHLSPRVLDLHHVRLDRENFAALVTAMQRLETLCADVGEIAHPSRELARLPRLTSLCLYAIRRPWIDTLVGLTRLTRLALPLVAVRPERPASRLLQYDGDDGGDTEGDDIQDVGDNFDRCYRLPASVTDLTLLRSYAVTYRIAWRSVLADVPHLEHLRVPVDFPPPSLLLRLVPRLRTLAACDHERWSDDRALDRDLEDELARGENSVATGGDGTGTAAPDASERPRLPIETLAYDTRLLGTGKQVLAKFVDPATVRRVRLRHYRWHRTLFGEMIAIEARADDEARLEFRLWLANLAGFQSVRHLHLRGVQHLIGVHEMRILCDSMLALERLEFATVCDERFQLWDVGNGAGAGVADPLFAPLESLTRLHTLKFGATANVWRCRLPRLPRLAHFCATDMRNSSTHSIATVALVLAAFPNLATLHVTAECIHGSAAATAVATAIRDHGKLRRLKLATRPHRERYGATVVAMDAKTVVVDIRALADKMRASASVSAATSASVSVSAAAAPTPLVIELAWCRLPQSLAAAVDSGRVYRCGRRRRGDCVRHVEALLGGPTKTGATSTAAAAPVILVVQCARPHRTKTACVCATFGGGAAQLRNGGGQRSSPTGGGGGSGDAGVCGVADTSLSRPRVCDCHGCPPLLRWTRWLPIVIVFAAGLVALVLTLSREAAEIWPRRVDV